MLHLTRQSLVLCTFFALIGTVLSACDSATAPERTAKAAHVEAAPDPCSTDPNELCPEEPVYCSVAAGVLATCAQMEPVERIVFSSGTELEAHLSTLYDASEEQLRAAEQQRGLALSLRGYLDNGESTQAGAALWAYTDGPTGNEAIALQNDGVLRDDFVLSDAFLSILNEKGEVQVGDSIYKVTRDNAYVVAPENLALLSQLVPTLSSPAPAADPRIVVHPVETSASGEEPLPVRTADVDATASGGLNLAIRKRTCSFEFAGGTRRMKGTSYITYLGVYGEAGVRTQWERKKFIGWSNTWQNGTLAYDHAARLTRGSGIAIWQSPPAGSNVGATQISRVLASGWFMNIYGWIDTKHMVSNSYGNEVCYSRVERWY